MDGAGASSVDKFSSHRLFQPRKEQILRHVDLSRKGSIDEYIVSLVECINSKHNYVTTSSCSGRIIIYCEVRCARVVQVIWSVCRVGRKRRNVSGYWLAINKSH